jgi:heptosyltransferase-1
LHTQSSFRLLVVRLGAMGDILHALPAVTALRQAHPSWQIGWVVDPRWQTLLKAGNEGPGEQDHGRAGNRQQATGSSQPRASAMPVVDQLHFAPSREWKRHPFSSETIRSINDLRHELQAAQYNAVLDLQGAIRSAVIARMSGCPRRIGEAHPREWPAQWFFTERIVTRGAHVIEQDVELARVVAGDKLEAGAPLLPVDAEAENWCTAWLAGHAAQSAARPLALIAPGAGWGAKRWPSERYAAVAAGLKDRGLAVLVNAGPGEESLAAPIAAAGAIPVSATLAQLIALTRRVALAIGGDTGPLHLAAALGRPVVGIYGPTDPSRNGPYGTRARVLRSPGSRRDHTRRDDPEAGLLTISSQDVLRAADELLSEKKAV